MVLDWTYNPSFIFSELYYIPIGLSSAPSWFLPKSKVTQRLKISRRCFFLTVSTIKVAAHHFMPQHLTLSLVNYSNSPAFSEMSYSDEGKLSPRDSDDHLSAGGGKVSPGTYKASRFANLQDLHKNHSLCISQRNPESWGSWNNFYSGLAVMEPIRGPILVEDRMVPYKDVLCENGKICETCRGITLEALLSSDGYLHQTLTLMDLAAKDGCEICYLVVESLTRSRPRRDRRESDFNHIDTKEPFRMRIANVIGTPYVQDTILICNGEYDGWLGVYTDEGY